MFIVYHSNTAITQIITGDGKSILFEKKTSIAQSLYQLASQFPDKKIVWCHNQCKEYLDLEMIDLLFHHDKMMLSYQPGNNNYLGNKIGYVEDSPFIKINKQVCYPTWQMSSKVGVIHASVLNELKGKINPDADLDYFLSSVAKVAMPLGLLCYSEPRLLRSKVNLVSPQANMRMLFRFVKQHYRTRWVFLLFLNLFLYERKFPLGSFLQAFFYKNRNKAKIELEAIEVQSNRKVISKGTVDVIIPTIGRKQHLYDVLKDFAKQTILPNKIIIVEQNPDTEAKSELDYIENEKWPFEIKHFFIHQAGACNARNLALKQTESEWVFLADDDIRVDDNFVETTFHFIQQLGIKAVSISCLRKGETEKYNKVFQWPAFGSGCSFVVSDILKDCEFNMGYEYGFGEDADFGMQIRNQGQDVLHLPSPKILHLKAPIGGFRTKPILKWQEEKIQPKPFPTVMLYNLLHKTKEQISGYKTTLFIKYYKRQKIKNPLKYYSMFKKQWKQSLFWANKLR
ncbi:MAG: glycosyltransferase family 2 protein [Flavobacterium sp.]